MLLLEAGATIAGRAGSAASLTVTIFGQVATDQADPTRGAGKRLYQGQVPAADTVLYTVDAYKVVAVRHIAVANPTAGAVTLKLWQGGITDPFLILPAVSILAGGFAVWHDGEWTFYDSAGKIQIPVGAGGGGSLTTQEAGVTLDAATTKINFLAGFDLTNPVAGEADVALDASEVAAAPTSSAVGDTSATGAAATFANSGHRHAREGFGSPVASAVGDAGADGTATTEARSDHKHGREAFAAPASSAPGDAGTTGTATTLVHSDHKHARESFGLVGDIVASAVADAAAAGASGKVADASHRHAREAFGSPVASAVGDTAADGTATTEARSDHRHAREGFGSPVASAVGDTAADGTATTEARADHRHAREAFAAPGSSAVGDSVNAGVATTEARSDHRHGREAFGSPVATAAANADGTATTEARSDHVHQTGAVADPLAYGIAWTVDPRQANAAQANAVNRCLYARVHGAMTVASLGIHVGTASGNISGAVYNTTGTGRAAKPNSRLQTTGAVACPAAGYATLALGASQAVTQGAHWFALAADNATVTFFGNADPGSSLTDGFKWQEAAAHPPPATATGVTSATARTFSVVGV